MTHFVPNQFYNVNDMKEGKLSQQFRKVPKRIDHGISQSY